MDHGNFYKCFTTGGRPLVVLGQPPPAVEPAERPLHDPAFGLRHEANLTHQLLDDYSQPTPANPRMAERRVEMGVAPDLLQSLDRPTQALHQSDAADAVLHRGRHYHQRPQQAERVNRHKPLAADDFFAPRGPPCSLVFTDWLSRMATDGLGFLPVAWRTLVRKASWIWSQVPSCCQRRK